MTLFLLILVIAFALLLATTAYAAAVCLSDLFGKKPADSPPQG